jgi:hypothetical protein
MKSKILKYFTIILFAVLVSSCCHKKLCTNDVVEIPIVNFTMQEADSVIVISYQKNTNFTAKVDSVFTAAKNSQVNASLLVIPFIHGLNIDLDYKIRFVSIGKIYLLNNFSLNKSECNSCFPWGHDYYDALDSYYINGQKRNIPVQIIK